jgi:hypothetical protein
VSEDPKANDRWEKIDPWLSRGKNIAAMLGAGIVVPPAVYYAISYLLQFFVVPHWHAIRAYGMLVLAFVFVFFTFSNRLPRHWQIKSRAAMPGFFGVMTYLAIREVISPSDPSTKRVWDFVLSVSLPMAPISAMLAAVHIIVRAITPNGDE